MGEENAGRQFVGSVRACCSGGGAVRLTLASLARAHKSSQKGNPDARAAGALVGRRTDRIYGAQNRECREH